ncbi:GNAT family N-acetyltransferase [Desulfobacula toluolica]|uniref:Putative acetyltransferase, GNAT family n=1 Tax=Desulfobacula toluolica (strain DSM 7467 / Tol2) TaxID=651182 RepID=K0N960_DESTT|nr:GNAT family N-acetyltransferase [Desulfobacula toluolica]CCK80479.1 putative acetyltransferase, GNAT family [Desulfobacula toluolica Tol2]
MITINIKNFFDIKKFFIIYVNLETLFKIDPLKFNVEHPKYTVKQITNVKSYDIHAINKAIMKMDFKPPFDIDEVKKRLIHGYYFIVLEYEDSIVGWSWSGINNVYIPEFKKNITLKKSKAFSFNSYISASHRKKGLGQLLMSKMMQILKSDGYKEFVGIIYTWNKASVNMYLNLSWRIIGKCYSIKIFMIRLLIGIKKIVI